MPAGALKGAKPGTVAAPSGTAKRTGTAAALIYEVASGDRGWDFQIVRFEIDLVAGAWADCIRATNACGFRRACVRRMELREGMVGWKKARSRSLTAGAK